MRPWLQPRCLLLYALLLAAPGIALAHLLASWLPGVWAVARLSRALGTETRQIAEEWRQAEQLRQQTAQLRKAAADGARSQTALWLPRRDRDGVMDRLAEALRGPGLSLEQLTVQEPRLCAAASPTEILACERISLLCAGDYAALTAALDRLAQGSLPIRFLDVTWTHKGERLLFAARLEIPFVPDATLREQFLKAGQIEFEEDDDDKP